MATETDLPIHMATSDGPAPAVETAAPLYLAQAEEDKVLTMIHGEEDDMVFGWAERLRQRRAGGSTALGRMSVSLDESEFDQMPARRIEMAPNETEGASGDEMDLLSGDDEAVAPFQPVTESLAERTFPVLSATLRRYQEADLQPRAVRIDTPESHDDMVSAAAVRELERRVGDLEAAVQAHVGDPYAHPHQHEGHRMLPLSRSEVLGAAQAVRALKSAKTADDAVDAMPKVPVDVPPTAQGKVKCWRDGDTVVCSMKFLAADGSPRVATMAAQPKVKAEDVAGWTQRSGLHPVTVLGALAEVADVAVAKRLVRDCAGAALRLQRRADVMGMAPGTGPLVFVQPRGGTAWPLAAVMELQEKCEAGDRQACREMALLERVAATPRGQKVAQPLLVEAKKRVAVARQKKQREGTILGALSAWGESFLGRYTQMGLCL